MDSDIPLLIEPEQLQEYLPRDNLLVIDLSRKEVHRQYHVPGAIHLEHQSLLANSPPIGGLLPDPQRLSQIFSQVGLRETSHVLAYDDEGGGKACRLLWTLDAVGHRQASLLNGGLHALVNEGFTLNNSTVTPNSTVFDAQLEDAPIADLDYILAHLDNPEVALLDTRSILEFQGKKRYALRGGHIPGAIHFDWANALDQGKNMRLRAAESLRAELTELALTPDKEVITYCQTHHRSSHTYFVLKWLGFPRVKGYAGSWSEWGNRQDTPIA